MVHESLAEISDRLVYAAILVYALAMLALAAEWAFGSRRFAPVAGTAEAKALVGAGAPVPVSAGDRVEPDAPGRAERFGRVGLSLAVLGFLLHAAGMATRGVAADRVPWGNMYEFSAMSALAAMGVFLALTRKYDIRWLGVFIVTPVLLTLGLAVTVLYTDAQQLQPALQSYWLVIHVIAAVDLGGRVHRRGRAEHSLHRQGRAPSAAVPGACAGCRPRTRSTVWPTGSTPSSSRCGRSP